MDYLLPHITARATQVTGTYDGKSNSPHVHRLEMNRKENFDADGMSGGPVFYIGARGIARYFIGLAGMVIRGSQTSDILHFIEADYLLLMAEHSGRRAYAS